MGGYIRPIICIIDRGVYKDGKLVIFSPYGFYQPNTGVKVEEVSWFIHFIGTDIYLWGPLPKTSNIENSYIS